MAYSVGVSVTYGRRWSYVVMSMQPRPWPEVPEQTARMARAAFRKGNLATRIRDELGQVYEDGRFVAVFGVRGRPGISPAQLMIVSVLQFAEDLTDRQAAEAVRDRITWKYALGLELDDPGFDASVLSEFRARLVDGELSSLALDALLQRLAALKLVKAAGRQRTDSTHVLAAIRRLNRLELAGETVRAALEALSAAAPDWLTTVIDASWLDVYGARIDNLRLPASQTRRDELLLQYGRDGYHLLDAVHQPDAPPWLAEIPAVQALRRIWIQQFCGDTDSSGRREVRRRDPAPSGDGVPPARDRIASPYEHDARYATKRGKAWTGYKVHLTETCDPPEPRTASGSTGRGDHPNLITNVVTTAASTADNAMTATIHQQLADKNLTPAEHLVDSGYPSAHLLVTAARDHGITLIAPLLTDNSTQARAGNGYDKAAFTIDYDTHHSVCPQGHTSSTWTPTQSHGTDTIIVAWPRHTCQPCPVKPLCTTSDRRKIGLQPRDLHEAATTHRTQQNTSEWKTRYHTRAGIEGTIRQTTHVTGIRTARYRGLPKTTLEHTLAATAINIIRLDHYWTGKPLNRTRTTHLQRLNFTLAA
ncbi:putative transposase [Actinoplanes missouriensis 431]|uniref:Putative transposase n=3 Tax=Actinoplanes missouriensis TaxID=1866 RepID=I0H9T8_ACTM4|nr:putative transposase [Actinoplanes missouriensis 431]